MQVVTLKTSPFVICQQELAQIRHVLESNQFSSAQLLQSLRHLDSLQLHAAELTSSQVGLSVKQLRKHDNEQVQRLATRLTQKWRDIVVKEMT